MSEEAVDTPSDEAVDDMQDQSADVEVEQVEDQAAENIADTSRDALLADPERLYGDYEHAQRKITEMSEELKAAREAQSMLQFLQSNPQVQELFSRGEQPQSPKEDKNEDTPSLDKIEDLMDLTGPQLQSLLQSQFKTWYDEANQAQAQYIQSLQEQATQREADDLIKTHGETTVQKYLPEMQRQKERFPDASLDELLWLASRNDKQLALKTATTANRVKAAEASVKPTNSGNGEIDFKSMSKDEQNDYIWDMATRKR